MKFWSICGKTATQAEEFASKYLARSFIPTYIDYKKFLDDKQLDVIVIATRDHRHAN